MMLPSVAAIPADIQQAPAIPQRTQNLFEYMAAQSQGLPEAANPAQLAQEAIEGMEGFLERTTRYFPTHSSNGDGARDFASGFPPAPREPGKDNPSAGSADSAVGKERINSVIDSLAKMFSYSTEVAVVARNASAISSSVNMLLRGQ